MLAIVLTSVLAKNDRSATDSGTGDITTAQPSTDITTAGDRPAVELLQGEGPSRAEYRGVR